MDFYIGGYAQGKLAYVKEKYRLSESDIADGASAEREQLMQAKCINHFHLWIRRQMEMEHPEKEVTDFIMERKKKCPDGIIICDEVGLGIVPLQKEERAYREATGHGCILLASWAQHMERIICGIGMKIK